MTAREFCNLHSCNSFTLVLHKNNALVSSQSEARDVFMYITAERIGRRKFLLPIIHNHCSFGKKKYIISLIQEKSLVETLTNYNYTKQLVKINQLMRESHLKKL